MRSAINSKSNSLQKENIYKTAIRFFDSSTTEKTYEAIVEEGAKLVGTKYGTLYIGTKGNLNRVYSTVPRNYRLNPRKKGFTYKTFKGGEPSILTSEDIKRAHPEARLGLYTTTVLIPLHHNNRSFGVLSLDSKNKKKFTQEELENMKLFGEIASLAAIKTQQYTKMKEALKSRDLFLSYASHEIKTPLSSIYLYTQMIGKKLKKGEEVDKKWLNVITKETARLKNLIEELIVTPTKAKSELQYEFKKTSLKAVINRCLADFWLIHPNHRVIVDDKLRSSKFVKGDFDKLCQAVINILNNAARFSPGGSDIKVDLYKRKPNLILTVTDKGAGIAKDDIPYVFEPFYKSKKSEGKGIGLHLVKEIIQKHNGQVKIKSQEGKGTAISLILPELKNEQ